MHPKEFVLDSDYFFIDVFLTILNIDMVFLNVLGIVNRMRFFRGSGTNGLFKFTVIIQILWVAFWTIKKGKCEIIRPISTLFIVFAFFSSLVGLLFNNFGSTFVKQLCEYIVPIMMIGVSNTILDSISTNVLLKQKWERIVIFNSYVYIICTILFHLMHGMGLMYWSAYTSSVCLFLIPYLLFMTERKPLAFALCAAGILSGGRSTLVRTVLIILIYYFSSKRPFSKKVKETVLIITGLIVAIILINNTHYFDRMLLTIDTLTEENPDLNLATGGRTGEIERVLSIMNSRPISWLIGNGFGVQQVLNKDSTRGFAHFVPLAYTMISGCVFTIVLYFSFLSQALKLFFIHNACGLMFCTYILVVVVVGSFFDAAILTDYKYWIVIGISFWYTVKREH